MARDSYKEAYHTSEYFTQHRRMLLDGDPRALICFCIDVSQSMGDWWVQSGGVLRTNGSGYNDGQSVYYFNPKTDIRPGYAHYRKIDKLNEVLSTLLKEFKQDRDINDKVAISIVTYSRFGKVVYDFLDCSQLDINSCKCTYTT